METAPPPPTPPGSGGSQGSEGFLHGPMGGAYGPESRQRVVNAGADAENRAADSYSVSTSGRVAYPEGAVPPLPPGVQMTDAEYEAVRQGKQVGQLPRTKASGNYHDKTGQFDDLPPIEGSAIGGVGAADMHSLKGLTKSRDEQAFNGASPGVTEEEFVRRIKSADEAKANLLGQDAESVTPEAAAEIIKTVTSEVRSRLGIEDSAELGEEGQKVFRAMLAALKGKKP